MMDGESDGDRESGGNDDESDSDGVCRMAIMGRTEYFRISRYVL